MIRHVDMEILCLYLQKLQHQDQQCLTALIMPDGKAKVLIIEPLKLYCLPGKSQGGTTTRVEADTVILATGGRPNAASDALLKEIRAAHPASVVGGFPVLEDRTLTWPGLE
eukprot:scaffold73484_cov16-Prasinocladus_malaysianus.AAC.1